MSRRNQHPGDWRARLIVLALSALGLAAVVLLVVGLLLANGSAR